jgi:hypothetical protein
VSEPAAKHSSLNKARGSVYFSAVSEQETTAATATAATAATAAVAVADGLDHTIFDAAQRSVFQVNTFTHTFQTDATDDCCGATTACLARCFDMSAICSSTAACTQCISAHCSYACMCICFIVVQQLILRDAYPRYVELHQQRLKSFLGGQGMKSPEAARVIQVTPLQQLTYF